MKTRTKKVLLDCLKRSRAALLFYGIIVLFESAITYLYALPLEPLLYGCLLIAFVGLLLFALFFARSLKRARERSAILASFPEDFRLLTDPETLAEADAQAMITRLGEYAEALRADFEADRQDMLDYYTVWVHQIKTPIAVMHLALDGSSSPEAPALSAELFRIEQYVEMVLAYLRLTGETNDLVVRSYPLDELLRETIRKYAGQFILRKLKLDYTPDDRQIITDKKWFSVILEQLLSNAIKYTPEGTISLRMEESVLHVEDTGIGIAAEDLPLIFEKGYTGQNGRKEQKSSGLGLYLCRRAADKLALPLAVQSHPGQGSVFSIDLSGHLTDAPKTAHPQKEDTP